MFIFEDLYFAAVLPLIKNPGHGFPRQPGHRGNILMDKLNPQNSALSAFFSIIFRKHKEKHLYSLCGIGKIQYLNFFYGFAKPRAKYLQQVLEHLILLKQ